MHMQFNSYRNGCGANIEHSFAYIKSYMIETLY